MWEGIRTIGKGHSKIEQNVHLCWREPLIAETIYYLI